MKFDGWLTYFHRHKFDTILNRNLFDYKILFKIKNHLYR